MRRHAIDRLLLVLMVLVGSVPLLVGCATRSGGPPADIAGLPMDGSYARLQADTTLARATFAGGCFWCMEPPFERLDGVEAAISGYAGGTAPDPTYAEVSAGRTDHVEAVQVYYDPAVVSYEALLHAFWRSFDPTDAGGQFADRGSQYESALFYRTERERGLAEASKQALADTGPFAGPIVTPLRAFTTFYPAEDYHQDYYKKNYREYSRYAEGSGRGPFLRAVWGDE